MQEERNNYKADLEKTIKLKNAQQIEYQDLLDVAKQLEA